MDKIRTELSERVANHSKTQTAHIKTFSITNRSVRTQIPFSLSSVICGKQINYASLQFGTKWQKQCEGARVYENIKWVVRTRLGIRFSQTNQPYNPNTLTLCLSLRIVHKWVLVWLEQDSLLFKLSSEIFSDLKHFRVSNDLEEAWTVVNFQKYGFIIMSVAVIG